jgi:hypothetical protein
MVHSNVGQQLFGSVPVCLAHWHAGAAHDVGGGVTLGSIDRMHTEHVYVGQQVSGLTPVLTGGCPFGQSCAVSGHAMGRDGSHVGF